MKRLLKILLYALGGFLTLTLAPYILFWLSMEWEMRAQTYDITDSNFSSIAVASLESLSCGSIPASIRVKRYFRQSNFNDGDELWLLESETNQGVIELVNRLRLRPLKQRGSIEKISGVLANKPAWVVRPQEKIKWLFSDADDQRPEVSQDCKTGLFYLWSIDGKAIFLYHIIT
ncbi:hypothetical protein RIF25_09115 [Thermosynechococcaceae cyanobacterium BACA0444]|uniref:Uncharacterized protein n=1 Tax=Pseudocalidococcus azoricus BACA0444 TaxID=2918990 RepID=A0AAE4FTE7_9CYAN|nr:hypothetical protein [Pseudocalidococcus azoricus]MDS3860972.1 hypothetical protein [Pseudocalidococcus azoricus BACA0444]